MNLRPYQAAASDAIFTEWREYDSTLVVMPTGGGKTVLFADVIRRVFQRRALVLAHREELIFQARDKIQRVTGLRADVEMGEYSAESGLFDSARVIVSTIQTQCSGGDGGGRMAKSRSLYSQMVGRSTRPLAGAVDWPETAEARRAACQPQFQLSAFPISDFPEWGPNLVKKR